MKTDCRSCGNKDLNEIVSLGLSPLANNLLDNVNQKDELYPLDVMLCKKCYNAQLSCVVPPELMFNTYLYVSSTAKSFRDHFKEAAKNYIKEFGLDSSSIVVDIGSNDGVGLLPFKEEGIKVVGVDPAENLVKLANEKGIKTIHSFFNFDAANTILNMFGKVDIVTASNVFAHSDSIKDITENVFRILKPDGCFIIEVQYFLDTLNDVTFDNIYHEHVNYWTVTSLQNFFNRLGLTVVKVAHVNTHGGSIRVYVKRDGSVVDASVQDFLSKEFEFGITDIKTYERFFESVQEIKRNVNSNLRSLKDKGFKIVGYGSPAKATTALNYFGVGTNYIDYIVEDNKLKHNKILPGVKIPIFPKEKIKEDKPDVVIVMAWNYVEEIKHNNKELVDSGVKFISIKELEKNVGTL